MKIGKKITQDDLAKAEAERDSLRAIRDEYDLKILDANRSISEMSRKLAASGKLKSARGVRMQLFWADGSETEATFVKETPDYRGIEYTFEHKYEHGKEVLDLLRFVVTNNKGDVNSRAFVQPAEYVRTGDTLSITYHTDKEWGA